MVVTVNRSSKEKDLFSRDCSFLLEDLFGVVSQRQGLPIYQAGLELVAVFLPCMLVL